MTTTPASLMTSRAQVRLAAETYLTGKLPDTTVRHASSIDPRRRCPTPLGGAFGRPGRRARAKVPAKMRFLLKMSLARIEPQKHARRAP